MGTRYPGYQHEEVGSDLSGTALLVVANLGEIGYQRYSYCG